MSTIDETCFSCLTVEFLGETDLANPTRLFPKSNSVYHGPINTSPRIQSGPAGGGISIPAKPDKHIVLLNCVTAKTYCGPSK